MACSPIPSQSYDFRNQLVGYGVWTGSSSFEYGVTNDYDPFARRVVEAVDDGTTELSVQYVYGCMSLWELVEQYDLDLDETLTTHVYGLGIDDEISYFDEGPTTPVQHWTQRDDQNTLTSVTDSTGAVEERYEYGDYGQAT